MAATDDFRDDDDILRELEDVEDEESSRLRESRLRQLEKEYLKTNVRLTLMSKLRENKHGMYEEVTQEKEILRLSTSAKRCIVHFFHKDFRRCQIMDSHLETLSRKHFKTKFAKIEVEKSPFLVEKLKIQMLPCVVCFVDGISVDRVIGFERLGGNDNFNTSQLEQLLASTGVLILSEDAPKGRKTIFGFKESDSEESDY